jgi:hypothetical protein
MSLTSTVWPVSELFIQYDILDNYNWTQVIGYRVLKAARSTCDIVSVFALNDSIGMSINLTV